MKNLQQEIIELTNEIRALKSSASLSPHTAAYSMTVNNPIRSDDTLHNTFRVTYADGENTILSDFLVSGATWAEPPVGNTQIVRTVPSVTGLTFTVYSTRPILGIEQIS